MIKMPPHSMEAELSVLDGLMIANDICESCFNAEGRSSENLLDKAEQEIMQISEERPKIGSLQLFLPLNFL